MAQLVRTRNDNARCGVLEKALQTATTDQANGTNFIMPDTYNALTTFVPQFISKVSTMSDSKANRIRETREKNESLARLVMTIRHGMHSVKNRVLRKDEPSEVLAHYEIPQSGLLPAIRPSEESVTLAKKIIEGDQVAESKGYPPMVNPDRAELSDAVELVLKEQSELAAADRILDIATEEIAQLRTTADELIEDIVDELQFNLRKMDEASARRIMRTYGFAFKNDNADEV